jgi:hypothetical protein
LLAVVGEPLTRKAVELALAGDRRHYGWCLGRIVGPHREPYGRIHDAGNPQRRRFGGAMGKR